jgi:hypothetical protein
MKWRKKSISTFDGAAVRPPRTARPPPPPSFSPHRPSPPAPPHPRQKKPYRSHQAAATSCLSVVRTPPSPSLAPATVSLTPPAIRHPHEPSSAGDPSHALGGAAVAGAPHPRLEDAPSLSLRTHAWSIRRPALTSPPFVVRRPPPCPLPSATLRRPPPPGRSLPAHRTHPLTPIRPANHALGPFLSFSPSTAQAPLSFSSSAAPSPSPFLLCARPSLPQGWCSCTRLPSRRRGRWHGVLQMGDPIVR